MSASDGRCPEHGLALGPNGECILCRREADPKPRAFGASTTLKIVFGVLLIALASAAGYRAFQKAEPLLRSPPPSERAPIAEAPEAPSPERERPRPPPRAHPREPEAPSIDEPPASALDSASARPEPDRYALLAARRRVRITLYSTSWCGHCRRAREYMSAEGIAYVEHDIDTDARAAQRLRAINPRGSVPTFDVDGTIQVGFGPGNLERLIDGAARRHL